MLEIKDFTILIGEFALNNINRNKLFRSGNV